MLNTTFNRLHQAGACTGGYRKLAAYLGGVNKYGPDTPIPLTTILESNGLADTLWCLQATIEPAQDLIIEYCCRAFEHVEHIWDAKYPNDKRPHLAIVAARRCLTDKSPEALKDAAHAADAAYTAYAAYAALHAADADEKDWQNEQLLSLLREKE